jgi:hypothetical protein
MRHHRAASSVQQQLYDCAAAAPVLPLTAPSPTALNRARSSLEVPFFVLQPLASGFRCPLYTAGFTLYMVTIIEIYSVKSGFAREEPWTFKSSFVYRPVYFIRDSLYKIYRVVSE